MNITVHYLAVDGCKRVHKFKTLKGAQTFAQEYVGETPELGSFYAVSGDGIGRVTVDGCDLRELFPKLKDDPPMVTTAQIHSITSHVKDNQPADGNLGWPIDTDHLASQAFAAAKAGMLKRVGSGWRTTPAGDELTKGHFQRNKDNHQAFFRKLSQLCAEHGALIHGQTVLFMDGLVDPNAKPGFEAETTARYLVHEISEDEAIVEPLEYNWVQQSVDLEQVCNHLWHENPGLITPCPECGEGGDDEETRTT